MASNEKKLFEGKINNILEDHDSIIFPDLSKML